MFCQSCGSPISSSPNVIIDPVTPGHQKKSVGKCIKIQILLQDGGYTVHRAHCYFIQYLEDNHRLRHKLWFATATGWSSGPHLSCLEDSVVVFDRYSLHVYVRFISLGASLHSTRGYGDSKIQWKIKAKMKKQANIVFTIVWMEELCRYCTYTVTI